jgi:chromodomain-helicase-DNA-binding protein 1
LQQAAHIVNITMSTSPDPSPVNGHTSPLSDPHQTYTFDDDQSDDDLSNAQQATGAGVTSPDSADAVGSPDESHELAEEEQQEESNPSDDDASGDGDFDAAGSPASVQSNEVSDRAGSASTRTTAKRKATHVLEDEYIRENPELYGLRRSVRPYLVLVRSLSGTDTSFPQSRPTQRRKIVSVDRFRHQ